MIANSEHQLRIGPFDARGLEEIGETGCYMHALSQDATLSDPQPVDEELTSQMRDGSVTRRSRYGNRSPKFMLEFTAPTSVQLARGIALFHLWCDSPTTFTWQHPDGLGVATEYEVVSATPSHQFDDLDQLRVREMHLLELECKPFGLSPTTITTADYAADGSPQIVPIVGSARAEATIEVFTTGSNGIGKVIVYTHPAILSGYDPTPPVTMIGAAVR